MTSGEGGKKTYKILAATDPEQLANAMTEWNHAGNWKVEGYSTTCTRPATMRAGKLRTEKLAVVQYSVLMSCDVP